MTIDEQVRTFVKQLERVALEAEGIQRMAPKNSDRHMWHVVLADGLEPIVYGIEPRVVDGCLIINNERDLDVLFYAAGTWRSCEFMPKAKDDQK
jgi:hypothetical protein